MAIQPSWPLTREVSRSLPIRVVFVAGVVPLVGPPGPLLLTLDEFPQQMSSYMRPLAAGTYCSGSGNSISFNISLTSQRTILELCLAAAPHPTSLVHH